jgi:hypothetical protein
MGTEEMKNLTTDQIAVMLGVLSSAIMVFSAILSRARNLRRKMEADAEAVVAAEKKEPCKVCHGDRWVQAAEYLEEPPEEELVRPCFFCNADGTEPKPLPIPVEQWSTNGSTEGFAVEAPSTIAEIHRLERALSAACGEPAVLSGELRENVLLRERAIALSRRLNHPSEPRSSFEPISADLVSAKQFPEPPIVEKPPVPKLSAFCPSCANRLRELATLYDHFEKIYDLNDPNVVPTKYQRQTIERLDAELRECKKCTGYDSFEKNL